MKLHITFINSIYFITIFKQEREVLVLSLKMHFNNSEILLFDFLLTILCPTNKFSTKYGVFKNLNIISKLIQLKIKPKLDMNYFIKKSKKKTFLPDIIITKIISMTCLISA